MAPTPLWPIDSVTAAPVAPVIDDNAFEWCAIQASQGIQTRGQARGCVVDWDSETGRTIHLIMESTRRLERIRWVPSPCWRYALLGVLLAGCWQATTVHFNYGGNWTGLFCTGEACRVPPELAAGTYIFKGAPGFDGQYYRFVAHDPWLQKGWSKYQDGPRLRYRRILVPGLAWLLAAGQFRYIDAAYISVILLSVFFGIYWLSCYAVFHGRSPAWGLGFLLIPGTLTSIDRLAVDIALVALCSGLVWYAKRDSPVGIFLVLVLAGLARETGLLLTAAVCLHALWNRRWRQAPIYATAALPTVLWYGFVVTHAVAAHPSRGGLVPRWFFQYPLAGIVMKLFQPEHYQLGPLLAGAFQALDAIALCGLLLALGLAAWGLRKGGWDQEQWATLAFIALALAVSTPDFWRNVYGYGRPLSPLVFLVGLRALSGGSLWALAPILMMDLRVAAQWAPQLRGVLRGIL
jgi:hypothetical protein